MEYTIKPMSMGYMPADKSVLMMRTDIGTPNKNTQNFFLVQGGAENILVDTGTLSADINPPERPQYTSVEEFRSMEDLLGERGVQCSDITKIILTHLHYDHCWNLEKFPNIPIYIQGREMEYAVNPIPFDFRYYGLLPGGDVPPWMLNISRVVRVNGDCELLPGIKLLLTPGHTKGSQCVLVDTKEGQYLLTGDTISRIEGYERGIPNGIIDNLYEWNDSYNRIKSIIDGPDKLLPAHEWMVHNRRIYG